MTATGQMMVRESEVLMPARVDMKQFLSHLSTDEGIKEQQQLSAAYDRACHALIGPNDIQVDGGREFKKKSAWRKLQRHFTISTAVVSVIEKFVQNDASESIFVAIVTVRAMAPWGQYAEAVGACATDEELGQRVITIADALATAETRATNRSVSNLIAMGEVSAEEIQKGNGSARGNTDMKRAEKDPGDFRIPFGPSKNKKLSEMETEDLGGALDWAIEKNKFAEFQKAAKAELDRRANPPKKEEPPAAAAPAAKKEPPPQIDPLTPPAGSSTSHTVPAPGKVSDALDPTSMRAYYERIRKALESTAISAETRELYADDNVNKFKGPGRHSIDWWANKLEAIAAMGRSPETRATPNDVGTGLNKQLDDLF
jgi:hypothetical protein